MKDDRGFVLVAVIWLAGLLAVVATSFALTARVHTLVARNAVNNTSAQYVADGMARLIALKLVRDVKSQQFRLNGVASFCQWSAGTSVGFRIQDQGGLIDLNVASPDLLKAVLRRVTTSDVKAQRLINALQDYRDPDSAAVGGGAEPATYANKYYGPKNAPFSLVEEIDQIPDVDDEVFAQLLPLVTVSSQQQGFDPTRAPQKLLDAVGPEIAQFTSPSPTNNFSIEVIVKSRGQSIFIRKALIGFILQPDRPFAILGWQRGRSAVEWQFPDEVQKPCLP